MIIRGTEIISGEGEVLTIQPGTTVKFKGAGQYIFGNGYADEGELVITNGATLIADGEQERITFELAGGGRGITFEEDASDDSILKYCEFKQVYVAVRNSSTTIKYNKFIEGSTIGCYLYSAPVIEYNTFDSEGSSNNTAIRYNHYWAGRESVVSPVIKHNDIKYHYFGVSFSKTDCPIVEYNNITNCEIYAVNWSTSGTVSNNYIANCNSIIGIDTTGEQSAAIYQNPRTTPVPDAGCGW